MREQERERGREMERKVEREATKCREEAEPVELVGPVKGVE